ncbi:MAG: glycoside hydrolase family 88 protein, partial [Saprospiraceae bacterium]|nr:glycoside hydrolase family 88 protein [Saprospiraceae bacterium]
MLKKTIFIYTLLIMYSTVYSQTDMAVQMAKTIMKQYSDSLVVKKYINHLMQDNLLQGNTSEADIEKANRRPANWNYEIGVVLTGFDRLWRSTGNQEYLRYTKKIIDHFLDSEGNIRTYHMDEFNIDNIPPGRQLISLYQVYKDKKYLKAAEKLKYQLDLQPRTKEGGYWHKLKYPYQMWLDGLYMGQPFRAEYLMLTGNDQEWDDVANQFIMMANGARDKKTGLMYHAFDESRVQRWSNAKTGHSPEFWSRAMGWYILGLVDVLEIFPETHPKK